MNHQLLALRYFLHTLPRKTWKERFLRVVREAYVTQHEITTLQLDYTLLCAWIEAHARDMGIVLEPAENETLALRTARYQSEIDKFTRRATNGTE